MTKDVWQTALKGEPGTARLVHFLSPKNFRLYKEASNFRMAQEHSKLCKDSHNTWESRSSGTSLQLAAIRLSG